jgi:hypothetical protein
MKKKHRTQIEMGMIIEEAVQLGGPERGSSDACQPDRRFEDIYKFFYPVVYGVIQTTLRPYGTYHDIEDLCQEVLTEIWEKRLNFNLYKERDTNESE